MGLLASVLPMVALVSASADGLSDEQVNIVVQRLAEGATHR